MKDATRYLEAVLPPSGLRVIAHKPPGWKNGFKHTFVATNEEVIQETARLDKAGIQSWLALATYADPEEGRTQVNTVALQCLWIDADFKNYDSPQAAAVDLAKMNAVVGEPSLTVQSGGGLHTYWVLRSALPTSQWKPLADAFQAAWQALGIKADPISGDAARVLRMPGTHNRKAEYGEPREVVLESFQDITYDAASLAKKLGAAKAKAPAAIIPSGIVVPAGLYDANDDLGAGLERRPSFIKPLVQKCRQMQLAFANQATQSEPVWYSVIQLARHLEDGRKVAHVFSNKHPDYSAENTEAKLAQLESKGVGPTTCARFRTVNPTGCEGCQFKVTSPIQLGYKEIENVEPTVVVVEHTVTEAGEVAIIERIEKPSVSIPAGFKYDGHALYKRSLDQETGMWKEEMVFDGFLCPERLVTSSRNNHATEVQMYVQSKGQEPKHITIPGKSLSEAKDLSRELTGKGVFFMTSQARNILEMVQRMVQEVQATRRDSAVADQMGWQDDGTFVVGSTGYRAAQGPQYDLPVPASTKSVARNYEPAGSLDEWKATANIYNRQGAEAYQFALVYGAAGVFLPMAKLSGVVLSLYSQSAGRGKSTAGYAALSWWGNPNGLKSQSKDTNNALFNKASRHKNLPILMDEITDKANHELEDLVYFMTQGREKERLTSESVARPILPEWALPVISTSNNSIRSKLQSRRGDAQGLFARIIEVSMDLPFAQELGYTDRMKLRTGFIENYGHAGPTLAKYVAENRVQCARVMDALTVKLDAAVEGDSAYRFWVASCAAALTVATAARQLGLLNYDLGALLRWTCDVLRAQRVDAVTNLAKADDILAQFLETNANRILVSYMRTIGVNATAPAVWPEEGVHGSQLVGRAELIDRSLYVSQPAFMRFCHEAGYDVSSFVRNAVATIDAASGEPLLKQTGAVSVNLGRGTKTAAARTKSLEFNLLHPALREFALGVDSKVADAAPLRSVK